MKPRRKWTRLILWSLALLPTMVLALIPLAVVTFWSMANTQAGRTEIIALADKFTGGSVTLTGWTGRFPQAIHLDQLALRDPHGAWCTLTNIDLDWTPHALLGGRLQIDRLHADTIDVARLAEPAQPAKPAVSNASSTPFRLPVRVDLRSFTVGRITLGATLAGQRVAVGPVALSGTVSGSITKPTADLTLNIDGAKAGAEGFDQLHATARGTDGAIDAELTLAGIALPGPQPELLHDTPLRLTVAMRLDRPDAPIKMRVSHPLLNLQGTMQTVDGVSTGAATLSLPRLAPFAAIGGVVLDGDAEIAAKVHQQGSDTALSAQGRLGIVNGPAPAPTLVGPDAHFALEAAMHGHDMTVSKAEFTGRAVMLRAQGGARNNQAHADGTLAISDLSSVRPELHGAVSANFKATGLPTAPEGSINLTGDINGGPVAVQVHGDRGQDGAMHLQIAQAAWKSAAAKGALTLAPGAIVPMGDLTLSVTRLADFGVLIGQTLRGSVDARVHTNTIAGVPVMDLHVAAKGAGNAMAQVGNALISGTIRNPLKEPSFDLALKADGIHAKGADGAAAASMRGPLDQLAIQASADLHGTHPAHLATKLGLDVPGHHVALDQLQATWQGENLHLDQPAAITFGPSMSVRHLRAGIGAARIAVDGDVTPNLALKADITNVTPALAAPFVPNVQASGTVSAHADLTGTIAAPRGTLKVDASGLRWISPGTQALPAGRVDLAATLAGQTAQIDLHASAGPNVQIAANGTVPLAATGSVALKANGAVDLALLDPLLSPDGRRVHGKIGFNLAAAGALPRPALSGTITLANGDVQDFAQGVHLSDVVATIEAQGSTIDITRFSANAGPGTIAITGSVDPLAPALPASIAVKMIHARPLASDLLTADLSGELHVGGGVVSGLTVSGGITVEKATVNLPERLPSAIAVLKIQKPGVPPPAPSAPIGLDITVQSPTTALFVRGHGLDAVLGGKLHVGGTSIAPQVNGGFRMQHGTFSLAGVTLDFAHGIVSFAGANSRGAIDPSLDFEADNTGAGMVAKLLVTGYASAPKISLASDPPLPQDEILAHLLFGVGTQQLGPVQIATIAEALAQISGLDSGPGILDRVRNGLGLDRLSVGSGSGNSIANSIPNLNQKQNGSTSTVNTSVEAGRYIANGVYLGAKQDTTGTGTQAELQIDLTKRLKLETDMGTGPGGNNIGLTYQFQY